MFELADKVGPAACGSFREHVRGSDTLSMSEFAVVSDALGDFNRDETIGKIGQIAEQHGLKQRAQARLLSKLSGRRES